MLENINQLRQRKQAAIVAAQSILNGAVSSARDMNEAETANYDAKVKEVQNLNAQIDRYVSLTAMQDPQRTETISSLPAITRPTENEDPKNPMASGKYMKAFMSMLRHGVNDLSPEFRASLVEGTPSAGGYAVPTEFDKQIVEKLVNANVMRQISSVFTTTSDRKILVENSVGSATWTAETVDSHNYDSTDDDSFAQKSLSAYKLTRIVKVSEELLQDEFFGLVAWLTRKFANAFGLAEEAAFVNGVGTTQPKGVVRDATLGVTATLHNDIAVDEVLNLFHALKRAYRVNASWLMTDAAALILRKKKDTTGQYIWQPGLQAGTPDVLLGKPVYISDFMPTPDNAGNKSVLFGDFSYYQIGDRSPRSFTRLNELYAQSGQVGFRGVERTDGILTLTEAIVYLAMGAAS